MLKRAVVIGLLTLPLFTLGQNVDLLSSFLETSPVASSKIDKKLLGHINHLRTMQSKKEQAFLYRIFWCTQRKFLKTYNPYEPFGALFESGKYDCLTATGLYSILLSEFNFDYSVIETNYHIFILVHTRQGDVLLESTDRFNGFVQDKKEIEKRIGSYKQNLLALSASSQSYRYTFDLYKPINPLQMTGLLYFNQAVNAFNRQEWLLCAEKLDLAREKYDSPRTKELAMLLIQTVTLRGEDETTRNNIMQRFKMYWKQDQVTIAMR